jgi:hypothetical protein
VTQEIRLAALLEERALKILPLQRKLRGAMMMERWAIDKTKTRRLLEFTRWRRSPPEELDAAEGLKPPSWKPPGPLLTGDMQAARLDEPSAICRG